MDKLKFRHRVDGLFIPVPYSDYNQSKSRPKDKRIIIIGKPMVMPAIPLMPRSGAFPI